MGVFLCGLVVLGSGGSQNSVVGVVSVSGPTVDFSQAMECQFREAINDQTLLVPNTVEKRQVFRSESSDSCAHRYVVIASPEELAVIPKTREQESLQQILEGSPMESFGGLLMRYAPNTRALAVGIAKQESNWGQYAPHKAGRDCYNYWGYKGMGKNGSVAGGYACFETPGESVATVVGRIDSLVARGLNTPRKMLVWKCGASCATHSSESVERWVGVVDGYYRQLN